MPRVAKLGCGTCNKIEHIPSEEILCDNCCERGRKFTVVCCGGLYHDAVRVLPHDRFGNPIPPTAAIILNSDIDLAFKSGGVGGGSSDDAESGWALKDAETVQARAEEAKAPFNPSTGERCTSTEAEWRPTLEYLVASGIPTIVSAPSKLQGEAVAAIFKDVLKFETTLLPFQLNPYAGLVPHRVAIPIGTGGERLCYTNQFLAAFQGGGGGGGDGAADHSSNTSKVLAPDVFELYCNGSARASLAEEPSDHAPHAARPASGK